MGMCEFTMAILSGLKTKGTNKNARIPVFPWKVFNCILYKPQSEFLPSNYNAARCYYPTQRPGELAGTLTSSPSSLAPTVKPSQRHLPGRS